MRTLSKVILLAVACVACEKEDQVEPVNTCPQTTGTLRVKNNSLHTVQRILVNGANHGSLDPGEERFFEKSPGDYTIQLVGLSGGSGCSAATVHIAACTVEGLSCSY